MPSTSGERMRVSPTLRPGPISMLNTPAGKPAREMISARAQAEEGTSSAGLNTTQLPKHNAGAIFHAGMAMGKFHGAMMPTTPSGWVNTSMPTSWRTDWYFSPSARRASWA
ncbi:hypothetical protein D9M73_266620 [compost metagenome]